MSRRCSLQRRGEVLGRRNPYTVGPHHECWRTNSRRFWTAQQAYAPDLLTAELKAKIARLLFFQRPIASQEHLIGRCELEPGERRASWATLEAQQFRVLQKANDLENRYTRVAAQSEADRRAARERLSGLTGRGRQEILNRKLPGNIGGVCSPIPSSGAAT